MRYHGAPMQAPRSGAPTLPAMVLAAPAQAMVLASAQAAALASPALVWAQALVMASSTLA